MSYGPPRPAGRLLLTPEDTQAPARVRRLRVLGLGERPEPVLDAFADRLAEVSATPYAMVNFLDEEGQFFAGLHTPATDGARTAPGRRLARDHGFCPHVVVRGKALVLEDVRDYPRFAGNPIVDGLGVRSYLGAPLIDRTGVVLGTVCALDVEPRPWGLAGLETIKAMAAELMERIQRREEEGLF
ncbi:GAF domain-containing protein [Streptomyces cavernae]|uniref:GAF domain-containing protein n=1 Tax=Streptomyces cavernae TaxID=2259034 RepID=UPI000FEC0858|nr:GAF domain-containing protein [Streptomyces cavernae]